MLETARDALRRLRQISNCGLQCHYCRYIIIIIIIIIVVVVVIIIIIMIGGGVI